MEYPKARSANPTGSDGITGARPSIFLSYPREDKPAVQPFVDAIVKRGVQVWRDEEEIVPGEDFTRRIEAGMAGSRIVVVWYSRRYPQSSYCMHEFSSAWLRSQALPGTPFDRILIVNPESDVAHIDAGDLARQNYLSIVPGSEPDPAIIDRIVEAAFSIEGVFGDVADPPVPEICPTRQRRYERFRGRRAKLWRIHSLFNPVPDDGASPVVQLVGLGGSGKSLLAVEYANSFAPAYPGGIFWLSAQGITEEQKITQEDRELRRMAQLAAIAESWRYAPWDPNSKTSIERHIARQLEDAPPYLWIVDDLPPDLDEKNEEFERRWRGPTRSARTLVTTRTKQYATSIGGAVCVKGLDPGAALALLTGDAPPRRGREKAAAERLLEQLVYHPLTVDVAGRLLKNNSWSFDDLSDRLTDTSRDPLGATAEALITELPDGYKRSTVQTLLISMRLLDERSLSLLRLASVIGSDLPVPLNLAEALLGRLWDLESPQDLETEFTGAVSKLKSQSLARDQGSVRAVRRLKVHGLVLYTMLHADPAGDAAEKLREQLTRELEALLLDADWFRPMSKKLPPRVFRYDYVVLAKVKTGSVSRIAQVVSEYDGLSVENRVELLQLLGRTNEELGDLEMAAGILNRAVTLCETHELARLRAEALTQLGIVRFHKGGFHHSCETFEQALALFESLGAGEQSEDYATCLDWIGEYHRELCEWSTALRYHEHAEQVTDRLLQEHERTDAPMEDRRIALENAKAHAHGNIGAVYYWQRDYRTALQYWRECLNICEGNEDRWNAHYLIDVGYMTFLVETDAPGRVESLRLLEEGRSLAVEKGFREEHARALMNMGTVHFLDNDQDSAEACYEEASALAVRYGSEKLIWRIQHNMGNIFARRGDHERAKEWFEKAGESVRRLIHDGYPLPEDRAAAMTHRLAVFFNLILVYLEDGDAARAATLAEVDDRLAAFLRRRERGESLEDEERGNRNHNFLVIEGRPYYIETE